MIAAWKDDVIMFALGQLEKFQPRDDYCELLELAIIFFRWHTSSWNTVAVPWRHSHGSLDGEGHLFHKDVALSQAVWATAAQRRLSKVSWCLQEVSPFITIVWHTGLKVHLLTVHRDMTQHCFVHYQSTRILKSPFAKAATIAFERFSSVMTMSPQRRNA